MPGNSLSQSRQLSVNGPLRGGWIYYPLVIALVLLPLPFGAYYQWSWAGFGILVAVLLFCSLPVYFRGNGILQFHGQRLCIPGLLYLLVLAWVALQASGLTPDGWDNPIWAQTSQALHDTLTGYISLDPYATWSEWLKMVTCAAVFWLAVVYGRNRKRARAGLWILSLAGASYALYALVAYLTEIGRTLWWHQMPRAHLGASSTFVNRNMYVDYAAYGLLAVYCLFLDSWLSLSKSIRSKRAFWKGLATQRRGSVLILFSMGLVLLAALIMTGSRGGVAATAIANAVLIVSLWKRNAVTHSSSRIAIGIGLAFLGVWALVYLFVGGHLGSRFAEAQMDVLGGRPAGYKLILRAIGEKPWTGYGAGNSLDVFYLQNDERIWNAFNYAHNIYLGAAVELGIPAAVLLLAAIALIAFSCYRGIYRRRRDRIYPALGFGVTVLVALHGMVDSPLYLIANAATYSFILGLAYSQSWPTQNHPAIWHSEAPRDQIGPMHQAPTEAQTE